MANQPQNQLLSIQQGINAQSWAGPAMAAGNTSIGNSYAGSTGLSGSGVAPPGYAGGTGSEPLSPAVAQPQGANVLIVPNSDGSGAAGAQLQLIATNAGTAGGGGQYPQTPTNAVPIPWLAAGWTSQFGTDVNEDSPDIAVFVLPQYTAAHGVIVANLFTPTISGGVGPYTVTTVEVDGLATSTLPTGFNLTASSGLIALTASTVASPPNQPYTLGFRVTDSTSPNHNFAEYEVTVILT